MVIALLLFAFVMSLIINRVEKAVRHHGDEKHIAPEEATGMEPDRLHTHQS